MGVTAYILFFIAGLGFGFAAVGKWKWLPLIFPVLLFLGAAYQDGVDGAMLIRLLVALGVTVGGVLLGVLLEQRGQRDEQPRYA